VVQLNQAKRAQLLIVNGVPRALGNRYTITCLNSSTLNSQLIE